MIRFSKDKKEGKIWLYIPSALILIWKGSQRERHLLTVLVLLILLSVPSFIHNIKVQRITGMIEQEHLLAAVAAASQIFSDVDIEAEAAYVFDIESGDVLYSKNEDKILPLASLTKIMTALVALETLSGDTEIQISKEALGQEGNNGLYLGERWQLSDLVKFMLISSSNDAAVALQIHSDNPPAGGLINTDNFMKRMNQKAVELGLSNTKFFNETGLDIIESEIGLPAEALAKAGAYGTAADMAKLFVYAIKKHPEIFRVTSKEEVEFVSLSGFVHRVPNTNILTNSFVNIIASKTGLTRLAGGNLLVVFDADLGRPVVAVVLGSTEEGRFTDMEKLIKASLY